MSETLLPFTLLHGDALAVLSSLPSESVHCCVTSPPYWGLRDYGVPGQLGLEPTPQEFIERMVALFREVRRVLRSDGTCWLNLGDSYAGSCGNYAPGGIKGVQRERTEGGERWERPAYGDTTHKPPTANRLEGIKPKDLVMVPHRLALALQEPYYTGRIKDERDRIWLAAMLDAEGCLFIHKRKIGQQNGGGYARKSDSFGPGIEIANTSEAIVRRCMEIAGCGSICRQDKDRRQPLFRWNLRCNESRDIVRELYPYLVAKQHQARILCGCPPSGERADAAHQALIILHAGGLTDVDFPAPESVTVPGWFVRSDIVWSKKNPMPESVTDRPTKAHEYVFLLTKAARYYYDADAVREPGLPESAERQAQGYSGLFKRAQLANPSDPRTNGYATGEGYQATGRNLRSVWNIATQPYPGAHFATFPEALVEPCIKAGTSERGVCASCGAPWRREVEREGGDTEAWRRPKLTAGMASRSSTLSLSGSKEWAERGSRRQTVAWQPSCSCISDALSAGERCVEAMDSLYETVPATVLDPFCGSGTTLAVATRLGRRSIGIDLSAAYLRLAEERILRGTVTPELSAEPLSGLFAEEPTP